MRTDGSRAARIAAVALLSAAAGLLVACNGTLFVQNQAYAPYAAPPGYTPDDTYYDLQWHYELIDVPAAWAIMREAGSPGGAARTPQTVRVAVIDTGVRAHQDLNEARLVDGFDFFSLDDGAYDNDATDEGPYGLTGFHGTHVTGTLAATTGNRNSVAGLGSIPGATQTDIMPLRAIGVHYNCVNPPCVEGSTFDIAQAILYAVGEENAGAVVPASPARVINLSLGGGQGIDRVLYDAIEGAVSSGATVIAAAGNTESGTNAEALGVFAPASYDNTLAIAAIGPTGERAFYSNIGASLDFAAPGGSIGADSNGDGYPEGGIWSTVEYPCTDPRHLFPELPPECSDLSGSSPVGPEQGTSMATPHVAGVVALLYSYAPELTQDVVYDILLASVDDVGDPGHDEFYGHGIVNARAALEYLIRATDDYGIAPIGGDDTEGGDGGSAGTARAGSGPMGRPILQREGAFLPAAAANVGIDYDAGSVVLALWEENLAPGEVAAARSRILDAIEGVTEIDGEDSQRLRARLVAGVDPEEVIRDLAAHPEVRYAQPNYLYTVPAGLAPPAAYPAGR